MRLTGAHDIALHVYQLVLAREETELEYATILEAHHPEYLSAGDLQVIFEGASGATLPPAELAELSGLLFEVEEQS